jgi:hypothetical protein
MTKERPFYAEKGFIACGALLAVVLLVGAAVALTGGSGHRETAASARHASASDSVCDLPAGRQDPVVGPPVASWTLVGHIAAPSVPGVGPGIVDGTDRRCYAHSPLGALLAAANVLPTTSAPNANGPKTVEHFMPGQTRDVYSKQPSAPVDPNLRVQLAAFRSQVISANAVDVTLAYRTNLNGVVGSIRWPMRWYRGDWRVQLGDTLEEPLAMEAPVTIDSSWIRWGNA